MRKHLILLAAVALMATAAMAQDACAFTNLEAGVSLQYCHDFAHGKPNLGADLRLTCQLTDVLRLRALANVNGFIPDGFDRYGTATLGLSAEYGMAYCFVDLGYSINPSSVQLANPDAGLGIGLRYDLAGLHHLFAETGFDLTPTPPRQWHGCYFLKLGYTVTLTKTPQQWAATKRN